MVIEVKITGGTMLVDDFKWLTFCLTIDRSCSINNSHGYVIFWYKRHMYRFHRWVMGYPKEDVGHRDAIRTHNFLENLYLCNDSVNRMNQNDPLYSNNSTGVRGVSYNKKVGKYIARIMVNNVSENLGWYLTLSEAASARKMAEENLNYVPLVKQS